MAYSFGSIIPAATSKPLVAAYDATVSSSTAISLNSKTTSLEVSAIDKGIFLKWDATASSTAFDGFIPANTSKVFSVPRDTVTANFIEESATAKLICIEF